jgi:hypothetical protein
MTRKTGDTHWISPEYIAILRKHLGTNYWAMDGCPEIVTTDHALQAESIARGPSAGFIFHNWTMENYKRNRPPLQVYAMDGYLGDVSPAEVYYFRRAQSYAARAVRNQAGAMG